MNCEHCKSENSIECYALQHDIKFYLAMGLGHDCSCSCHVHSDEQIVENFKRFLKEVGRGPIPVPEVKP